MELRLHFTKLITVFKQNDVFIDDSFSTGALIGPSDDILNCCAHFAHTLELITEKLVQCDEILHVQ